MRDKGLVDKAYIYIVQYKMANRGVSPSINQISAELGVNSSSMIHKILRILESNKRIIIHKAPISRGIVVVGALWIAPDVRPPSFPTDRSKLLYQAVIDHCSRNDGNSPSYRLLCAMTGIPTISQVNIHLKKLDALGILHVALGGINRHISVPNSQWIPPSKVAKHESE